MNILIIRFTDDEHFNEIKEDLDNLIKLGVHKESITTDGHKSILKAIKKSLPDVLAQRRLVHIQRMFLMWLKVSEAYCRYRIKATCPVRY